MMLPGAAALLMQPPMQQWQGRRPSRPSLASPRVRRPRLAGFNAMPLSPPMWSTGVHGRRSTARSQSALCLECRRRRRAPSPAPLLWLFTVALHTPLLWPHLTVRGRPGKLRRALGRAPQADTARRRYSSCRRNCRRSRHRSCRHRSRRCLFTRCEFRLPVPMHSPLPTRSAFCDLPP